jgi:hypothetical protein
MALQTQASGMTSEPALALDLKVSSVSSKERELAH